jgi:plastocyanin
VTWINDDSGRHTVTSKDDGVFDSGMMGKGQSFSFTFDKAGEYPYFCSPHPGMVGTVVVTES